jgi:hypothetical protein
VSNLLKQKMKCCWLTPLGITGCEQLDPGTVTVMETHTVLFFLSPPSPLSTPFPLPSPPFLSLLYSSDPGVTAIFTHPQKKLYSRREDSQPTAYPPCSYWPIIHSGCYSLDLEYSLKGPCEDLCVVPSLTLLGGSGDFKK